MVVFVVPLPKLSCVSGPNGAYAALETSVVPFELALSARSAKSKL